MLVLSQQLDRDPLVDRHTYEYVPSVQLDQTLSLLVNIQTPKFGERFQAQVYPTVVLRPA